MAEMPHTYIASVLQYVCRLLTFLFRYLQALQLASTSYLVVGVTVLLEYTPLEE